MIMRLGVIPRSPYHQSIKQRRAMQYVGDRDAAFSVFSGCSSVVDQLCEQRLGRVDNLSGFPFRNRSRSSMNWRNELSF
jgi:hypothetical protein